MACRGCSASREHDRDPTQARQTPPLRDSHRHSRSDPSAERIQDPGGTPLVLGGLSSIGGSVGVVAPVGFQAPLLAVAAYVGCGDLACDGGDLRRDLVYFASNRLGHEQTVEKYCEAKMPADAHTKSEADANADCKPGCACIGVCKQVCNYYPISEADAEKEAQKRGKKLSDVPPAGENEIITDEYRVFVLVEYGWTTSGKCKPS